MPYWVTIVRLKNGALEVGCTGELKTRTIDHRRWAGGKFTGVVERKKLLYTEYFPDEESARRREREIKGWSHARRLAFIRRER